MSAPSPAKWLLSILVVLICLSGGVPARAEDDPYPDFVNHNTVSHSVAAFTGAAGATIPIEVPPGRNGMQPSLALNYSSFARNGWLGVGWNLEIGSIRRNTKHGLDYNGRDFLAGEAELISWSGWGTNAYRAKIEGEFSRYFYNPSGDTWVVQAKDGRVMYYGSNDASRQSNGEGTFKWCLDRVEDPNGNYMTITYTKHQGQIYPLQVDYAGHSTLSPYYYVRFYLEDRNDGEVSFARRSGTITAKRLKTIAVASDDGLIRAYQLSYSASPITNRSVLTNVRLFGNNASIDGIGTITGGTAIQLAAIGYKQSADEILQKPFIDNSQHPEYLKYKMLQLDVNGDGAQDFVQAKTSQENTVLLINLFQANPVTGFEYKKQWVVPSPTGHILLDTSKKVPPIQVADINGDGKDDFLITPLKQQLRSQYYSAILADSNGDYTTMLPITPPASANWNTYPADVNGDGMQDIVFMRYRDENLNEDGGQCYEPEVEYQESVEVRIGCANINVAATWTHFSNGDGTFSESIPWDAPDWDDSEKMHDDQTMRRFADFNGDGKADLLLAKEGTEVNAMVSVAIGNGDGTFQEPRPVSFTHVASSSNAFSLADFNGDGMMDLYSVIDKNPLTLNIEISKGDGTFAHLVQNMNFDSSHAYPRAGDINGDGKSDLISVYIHDEYSRVRVMFSDGNGILSAPVLWVDDTRYARFFPTLGDYNGDGQTDMVFHRLNTSEHEYGWHIRLVPSTSVVEGRLHTLTNPLGGVTQIDYGPVAAYGTARMPYGMSVVTKTTTTDPIRQISSETLYAYRGGFHHAGEREFRGFKEVITTAQNGCQSQTLYHQDMFRKGRAYELNTFGPGDVYGGQPGEAHGQVKTTWENTFLEYMQCAYVRIADTQTIAIENGQPVTTVTETMGYDSDGNLEQVETTTSDMSVSPQRKIYGHHNYGPWLWRRTQERLEERVDGSWRVVRQVDFGHDGDGNLTRKVSFNDQGDDVVETYDSDPYGNIETQTNGRGYSTHIVYDSIVHTYPVESSNCAGHTATKQWDFGLGQPDWEEDPNQTLTDYTYDTFGRPKKVEVLDKNGARKALSITEYFITNRPAYVKKRVLEKMVGGAAYIDTWQYFDGLGRKIQSVHLNEEGRPVVSQVFYDTSGRQYDSYGPFLGTWSESNPEGSLFAIPFVSPRTWSESFDDRNRPLVTKSRNTGGQIATTYQYSGTSTTVTDADGASKTTIQDALGRVKRVIEDPNGRAITTRYTYNAAGDLLQVRDALNNLTTMGYDTLGRKLSMNDPDMGSWSYRYDASGNLTWQQDARGQQIEFTFDCVERPTLKHYVNPLAGVDRDVTYTYDDPSVTLENHIGRLSRVTNGEVTTVYETYDALGQATLLTKTIGGDQPRSTAHAFDLAGRPKHMVYPDGYEVSYQYHPGCGLLHKVTGLGADGVEVVLATYTNYPVTGNIGTILFGNNAQTQYDYDPLSGRLLDLLTMDSTNANIVDRSYTYTPAGDIQTLTDASNPANVITRQYSYDGLHRLRSESILSGQDDYNYLKPAVMGYSYTPGSKPLHAVSAIDNLGGPPQEFNYDANGNLLSGPDMSDPESPALRIIGYNSDNMPVSINHSAHGTTTLAYDGGGTRAKKSGPSGTTYYVGSHFEVNGSSGIKYIFAGSQRVAMIKPSGNIYYFHQDHLGSSAVLTDSTGVKYQQTDYLPYGAQRSTAAISATNYGFTGQEKDPETGLYNYNARFYDQTIGVFLSADTIVQDYSDPQTLNRYSYCRNLPLKYVDPTGHLFGIDDAVIIAVAATVAKSAAVGAAIGGTMAAATGGDIMQGIGMGAISGAFMGGFGGSFVGNVAAGAAAGATNAALYGGDIGNAAIYGGILGGVSTFGSPALTPFGKSQMGWIANRIFNSALVGGPVGGMMSMASGGDFQNGFIAGAKAWAIGSAANQVIGHVAGNLMNGYRGPSSFNKDSGNYIYTTKNPKYYGVAFSIGGVISGHEDTLYRSLWLTVNNSLAQKQNYSVLEHEIFCHNPQQPVLGPGYIPAILFSYGVSWIFTGNTHYMSPFDHGWDNGYPSY